jgi:tetratricopeptide (TPR) repeat protein
MRAPAPALLLGALAVVALVAVVVGDRADAPPPAPIVAPVLQAVAEEALPLPPEPPRLAEGPEVDRCFTLLQLDAEAAFAFALAWDAAGGGEGARHCGALATLALGDPARAADRLEQLALRSRAGVAARAAVLAQAGQAWLMADQPNRAYGATTMALALLPEDVDLLIDRAVALGSLERYVEAIADLDKALSIDAERPDALVFRASAWRRIDRAEVALRDVDQALAIAPDSAEALLERGILRQMAGDAEGARADWERAMELAPNSATADLAAQNLALSEAGPFRR